MATTDLQTFTNNAFGSIRTINHGGKVYFCGRDVATALGYKDPNNAMKQLCKGVAVHHPLLTDGGIQQDRFVIEGDLYRLIFSSTLPAAQAFEAWVSDEVLPIIRRHDVYAIDELLSNDEFLEQAIVQLSAERAKRLTAEQALLEAVPKVSYYDMLLQSASLLTMTEIAKDYSLSAKRMNAILHEEGVQFRQSGRWFLYARYAEHGYTQSKTHEYDEGKTRTHMYWTQKGRLFIYDLMKNRLGLLPVIEQDGGAA
ncbi:phage antirepressor [Glutamicibacter sp. X7]